jgi:hypothetical protein
MRKTYSGLIETLKPTQIFVFGANTKGRHGKGAAWTALDKFGAIYGQASGRQGQSYSLITKDLSQRVHPSISEESIIKQIEVLYDYARTDSDLEFFVAYSGEGTNLNGYTPQEMAEMFNRPEIPENIVFEDKFWKIILTQNLSKLDSTV